MNQYSHDLPLQSVRILSFPEEEITRSADHQFFYVLQGELRILFPAGLTAYPAGSCLLLLPGKSCTFFPDAKARLLCVTLDSGFVLSHLENASSLFCDSVRNPFWDYREICSLLLHLKEIDPPSSRAAFLEETGLVYRLLSICARIPSPDLPSAPGVPAHDRSEEIRAYIDEHYQEPLSLTELAGIFFLSPQYLSSFFRKYFGVTFKTFLDSKRLFYALRDLQNTSLPIHEISLRNGFSSAAAFRRSFEKAYGISPTGFRKRRRAVPEARTDSETRIGSGAAKDSGGRTAPFPAKGNPPEAKRCLPLTVSIETDLPGTPLKQTETILNIGSAHNLLSENYRTGLLSFCLAREIRCIRLMEMVSNSFVPMTLPDYEYYFQNLDISLSFLYKNGLFPIVELSRLPFSFPFLNEERKNYSYIRRNSRYFLLLEAVLLHISQRFPKNWLSRWKFEFCMAPWDTLKTCLEDLSRIRGLLSQYLPGAMLGGPGYDPCVSPVSLQELLPALKERSGSLDFFSTYLHYHAPARNPLPGESYPVSPDPDLLMNRCREICTLVSAALPKLPFWVTEWTSAYIKGFPIADSRYQAAFFARTAAALREMCSLSSYWLFSDEKKRSPLTPESPLTEEYDLSDTFGYANACHYAFIFCSRLGDELLKKGENYCLFRKNERHYQLLVWNYAHFVPSKKEQLPPDFDQVYHLFEEVPDLDCHFTLTHLPPGTYNVRRILLDEFHGSVLDILIGEYRHSNISKVDFFRHAILPMQNQSSFRSLACLPYERSIYVRTEGSLQLNVRLCAHDVCLWDIRKQAGNGPV